MDIKTFTQFILADKHIFYIDEVREWLDSYQKKQITFDKFVELFNEKFYDWYKENHVQVAPPADVTALRDQQSAQFLKDNWMENDSVQKYYKAGFDLCYSTYVIPLKVQIGAYKTLQRTGEEIRSHYEKKATEAVVAVKTIDSEREANAILTEENLQLKKDLEERSIQLGQLTKKYSELQSAGEK